MDEELSKDFGDLCTNLAANIYELHLKHKVNEKALLEAVKTFCDEVINSPIIEGSTNE